jgi:carboxypeptidase family protein/flagellar hook capping protein FlgD
MDYRKLLRMLCAGVMTCTLVAAGARPAAAVDPPIWNIVDSSTIPGERPAILDGQRSLWCGKFDLSWAQTVGYPNCTYQILYLDTGSHSSDYVLTLLMNASVEWTYDYLYLVGGGGGAADPIGINSTMLDQAIATGSSGTARLLASWTGSIQAVTPGAFSIDTRSGPVSIVGDDGFTGGSGINHNPTTVNSAITIASGHRALYFVLESDQLFSSQDGLWPWGHGIVLDDVATGDNGSIYAEQTAAGGTDAFGGTVLVGTPSSPVASARTTDRPPEVDLAPASILVAEGGQAVIFAFASDPDCGAAPSTLTADLSELPVVNDAVVHTLSTPPGTLGVDLVWHPAIGDAGVYHVTFTAANDLSGSATAVITVARVGTVAGVVTGTCNGTTAPIAGVAVDAFVVGSGQLTGTAVTDNTGHYTMTNVPESDYTIGLVMPFGYSTASAEVPVTVTSGQTVTANFALTCVASAGNPQSSGFWKHQFGIANGGGGNAQVDQAALCSYLDMIKAHFNNNALNQVVIYNPPAGAVCLLKVRIASGLLDLSGSPAPIDKAKQQLLALMLNVAANYIGLTDVISKDGATVSQAITYCDQLIDNPSGDRGLAAAIAEKINSGQKVNSGVIPLGTQQIAYRASLALSTFRVTPNPGPGAWNFQFAMGQAGSVRLQVFDVSGRLVSTLANGSMEAGPHSIHWDGRAGRLGRAGSGIYFARLETAAGSKTLKVVRLAR